MIETWILVLALFIPRITILIAYFSHQIPYNNIPMVADVLLYVFLPRVLMLIYIIDNLGINSAWFWIHLVVAILVWSKSSHVAYKKKFRRN